MTISEADESEIRAALAGQSPVNPGDWNEAWASNVRFVLPNGWVVFVFNDCDSWDYVDSIEAPDGRVWDLFPPEDDDPDSLFDWRPDDIAEWGVTQ